MILLLRVTGRTTIRTQRYPGGEAALKVEELGEVEFFSPAHQQAALEPPPVIAERVANIEPFIPASSSKEDHG